MPGRVPWDLRGIPWDPIGGDPVKPMGPWAHWPQGPRPPGPGPHGPGAHGPEIIIRMSRMIICQDDKKLIIPKNLLS